jgi:hypothetical protein
VPRLLALEALERHEGAIREFGTALALDAEFPEAEAARAALESAREALESEPETREAEAGSS